MAGRGGRWWASADAARGWCLDDASRSASDSDDDDIDDDRAFIAAAGSHGDDTDTDDERDDDERDDDERDDDEPADDDSSQSADAIGGASGHRRRARQTGLSGGRGDQERVHQLATARLSGGVCPTQRCGLHLE
jgi:hypothetical protein